MLVVTFFLGITTFTAIILNIVGRTHDTSAFFASIPLLAFTNFSTIIVLYLVPPRPLEQTTFTTAHDLIFYGAAAIIGVVCGKNFMREMLTPSREAKQKERNQKENSQFGAALFFSLIILGVWCHLVFKGQIYLTKTLLPEITHPVEIESRKEKS